MNRLSTFHAWAMIGLVALTLAYMVLFMHGVRAHDIPGVSPEYQQWASNVQTTEPAFKRLGWRKCCNHAEVFRTKFMPVKENGQDGYLYEVSEGVYKRVPQDIIKWDERAPDGRPTLFIYQGKETCFFPAEGGI